MNRRKFLRRSFAVTTVILGCYSSDSGLSWGPAEVLNDFSLLLNNRVSLPAPLQDKAAQKPELLSEAASQNLRFRSGLHPGRETHLVLLLSREVESLPFRARRKRNRRTSGPTWGRGFEGRFPC